MALEPFVKAASWVLDRHYDVCMALVIETRSWFEAGEALTGDLENWLYRNHKPL